MRLQDLLLAVVGFISVAGGAWAADYDAEMVFHQCIPQIIESGGLHFSESMRPGEQREVRVTMKNTGSTPWVGGGPFKLGVVNDTYPGRWDFWRAVLPEAVEPEGLADFTFLITAPNLENGQDHSDFDLDLSMFRNNGQGFVEFGSPVHLVVRVAESDAPNFGTDDFTVFVAMGQSNMTGADSCYQDLCQDPADLENINTFWNSQTDKCGWSPMTTNGIRFGADWHFARTLQKWGGLPTRIAIIKFSKGGSNLDVDWDPESDDPLEEQLYRRMSEFVHTRLQELDEVAGKVHLGGFLWLQGESDSTNVTRALAYQTNLTDFIGYLRAEFSETDWWPTSLSYEIPFVLARIQEFSTHPYREEVRTAQVNVTTNLADVAWVDTDNLPTATQGVGCPNGPKAPGASIHFHSEAQKMIGTLMAIEYLNIILHE